MALPVHDLAPYRIGAMVDLPEMEGLSNEFVDGLKFAFEEAYQNKKLDRPVEVVERHYFAQPWEDGRRNLEVFYDLVDNERVLGIAGPMTTDNSLAVLPAVEERRIPTLTICGTQLYVGEYAFNLSNGGMGDEPAVIGAWLRSENLRRVAIIKDYPSQIGAEYTHYMRYTCEIENLSIVAEANVAPRADQEEVTAGLAALRASDPDALIYFGLGLLPAKLTIGLKALEWDVPRIMCTAFVGATYSADLIPGFIGWVGVDQYDERNTVLSEMVKRFKEKKGRPIAANSATSCGYDAGRALAIGLSRMAIATPEALKKGLETVRMMPASTGAPGTVITFGPQDHRGFKGPGYLVLRRGIPGGSELIGVADFR